MTEQKSMVELAAAAAITDTSSSNISNVQGKIWADKVVKAGQALRRFDEAIDMDESLVGSGDKTLSIPKTTSVLSIDTSPAGGEGDVRDNTEMTHINTTDITIAASDFRRGLISISKQIALTSRVDLVKLARQEIANGIADDLDTDIASTLQDTSVTHNVYGGDATGVDELTTGDTITTDLIADAMDLIEEDNFVPFGFYMSTKQHKVFRKDSQFTNASEYGSQDIVLKGEVGEYLGVRFVTTTNAPAYASSATDTNETPTTWGAAGHACIMVGSNTDGEKVAATNAWKEMPQVNYMFEPDEAIHKVFYDQTFKSDVVQEDAITLVKVTDA